MKVSNLFSLVGRETVWLVVPGVGIDVRIINAKLSYGRTLALVEPIAGKGTKWVRLDSLALDQEV